MSDGLLRYSGVLGVKPVAQSSKAAMSAEKSRASTCGHLSCSDTETGQTSKAPGRAAKMCKETATALGAGGSVSCHGRELMFCLVHEPLQNFRTLRYAGALASTCDAQSEYDCVLTALHN